MKRLLSILLGCLMLAGAAGSLAACDVPNEPEATYTETLLEIESSGGTLGMKLNVPDEAEGRLPVMILCVGAGNKYSFLNDPADYYAKNGFATVRFDYTCTGMEGSLSTGDQINYSLVSMQDNIKDILDYLAADPEGRFDLDRVLLWGYSLGGLIAACFTSNYPDLIKDLILMAPAFDMYEKAHSGEWGGVEIDLDHLPDYIVTDEGSIVGKDYILQCAAMNYEEMLSVYTNPVLVCTGTADPSMPYSEMVNALYRNSTLVKIEGGTHTMILNIPKDVFAAVDAFLLEHPV